MSNRINEINNKLSEISSKHNIEVLYACESGSRAWGFPSPDSDYDVRFIFIRPTDDYLLLLPKDDTINLAITNLLDFSGWDIRKILLHIGKSAATPSEWLQSPIVYYENQQFKEQMLELCQMYFSARVMAYHYIGKAKSSWKTFNDGIISIKKLLYVLHTVLAAKWAIEKNSIPPIRFNDLLSIIDSNDLIINQINKIVALKLKTNEPEQVKLENTMINYIEDELQQNIDRVKNIPVRKHDIGKLSNFFINYIKQNDN